MNEVFVQQYFPGRDPIGQRFKHDHAQSCQRIVDVRLVQEMRDLVAAIDEHGVPGGRIDDRRIKDRKSVV